MEILLTHTKKKFLKFMIEHCYFINPTKTVIKNFKRYPFCTKYESIGNKLKKKICKNESIMIIFIDLL